MFFFFFFQAEDGIRDYKVTGVQTCALPISKPDGPGVSRSRFRKSRVSRVMVDEPLWAKDARVAGGGRCPPRRRSRGSAEGRRGLEWRTGASAGRESPRPGESRTGASTGRPARTQSYRATARSRSEEHTSELQSPCNLVCRLLLEKKKKKNRRTNNTQRLQ